MISASRIQAREEPTVLVHTHEMVVSTLSCRHLNLYHCLQSITFMHLCWWSLADFDIPSSRGTKFLVAFMQNIIPTALTIPVPDTYFIVTTSEAGVVDFNVTNVFGGVTTYEVNSTHPTRVNFGADDVYVTNIYQRNKAILIETRNKMISVFVINSEFGSTDGFVALPCDSMTVESDFRRYDYLILSAEHDIAHQAGAIPRPSQFVIITCEADTVVTVTPSTNIGSSGVFEHTLFGPSSAETSSNYIHNGSDNIAAELTFFISKVNADFTGTRITSTKPLVVISGHQCGHVTETVTACDHMATQISPHTTWGSTFLLNPLSGRQSGDLYRFATLLDNTDITITCVNDGGSSGTVEYTTTLNSAQGSNWGQFETHSSTCNSIYVPKYCCLESSNPVIVAQYSYGYTRDAACNGEVSDPFLTLIPPVIQYLSSYHLVPVNVTSGLFYYSFFSVTVPVMYFQAHSIMLDDVVLEPNASLWQAIYCSSGDICGYGITKDFDNQHHVLFHTNINAAIFVHTYGFNIRSSYALAGGMELQPISGKQSCNL